MPRNATSPTDGTIEHREQRRLNLGCGRTYHPEWCNLDLESDDPAVIRHDVTQGLPFADGQFDVVYHSHILEHLKPEDGVAMLGECLRVLKPGGVLRIVVPDLERIARLYLEMHELAWAGDDQAKTDYNWIKLELLDQLVREYSGGRMGRYMADPDIQNSDFVRSRVGDEFWICREPEVVGQSSPGCATRKRWAIGWRRFRESFARTVVRWLLGPQSVEAMDEGLFRSRGEIHRWMYDRFSLQELCRQVGFVDFRVCEADQSDIEDFSRFELDTVGTSVRKPDSLFVECRRPPLAAQQPLRRAS